MNRFQAALTGLVIVAVAACTSSGSAPAASPSAVVASSPPTAAPIATAVPSAAPSAAAASASLVAGQTISLYEWKVIVATTLKPGSSNFKISNFGTEPHELLVFKSDLAPSAYPTDAAGDIKEEGAGVTLVSDGDNIDPAGSQERAIDLAPGTYLFVCNIPGHFKQGMFTVVTVSS